MKQFFRYLIVILADPKRLAEAVNNSSTSAELDEFVREEVSIKSEKF